MIRIRVFGLAVALLFCGTLPGVAQSPTDPASSQKVRSEQQAQGKLHSKRACREEAKSTGMRGVELRNRVKVCQAEARLACEKKAAEAHASGPARRDLIDKCLGEL